MNKRIIVVGTAAIALSAAASARANLVQNGSFAAGLTGWTASDWGSDGGSGVVADGATPDWAYTPCVGPNCITVPIASLAQVLSTTAGDTYTLSFSYNAGAGASTANTELQVDWNGSVVDAIFTDQDLTWNDYIITGLAATSGATTLEFDGRQDPAEAAVTNVDVELGATTVPAPVPEPTSLALFGMAAAGFAMIRGNRRSWQRPVTKPRGSRRDGSLA